MYEGDDCACDCDCDEEWKGLDDVGVTGLVGFEAEGSELPSLVRFFLRNPREGIGQDFQGEGRERKNYTNEGQRERSPSPARNSDQLRKRSIKVSKPLQINQSRRRLLGTKASQ